MLLSFIKENAVPGYTTLSTQSHDMIQGQPYE